MSSSSRAWSPTGTSAAASPTRRGSRSGWTPRASSSCAGRRRPNGSPPESKPREPARVQAPAHRRPPARVVVRAEPPARRRSSARRRTPAGSRRPPRRPRPRLMRSATPSRRSPTASAPPRGRGSPRRRSTWPSGFFEAEGVVEGDPRLKAGGRVAIAEVGRFNGTYELSAVTHVYGHGEVARASGSAAATRGASDPTRPRRSATRAGTWSSASSRTSTTRSRSAASGSRGRRCIESAWARVALPAAGPSKGLMFRPMVGDEALVLFEHGDTRRPVVVGFLHNGADAPHDTMPGKPAHAARS